ncbi:PLP-dependent aminotransferase family protein (plasmid) [Pantoea vagans]|uniref:aminotransferase-like domain-containing protein n=1 Tax=Pantoea vagans TaxID=470934 RepID=UPI0037700CBA
MFIYEKVAEDIARAVSGGQLLPGVRIPSIRDYAITHGISINSVKTAYRLLEDRGIITARSQSGYFVNPRVPELSYPEKIYAPDETLPLSGISHLLSVIVEKQQNGDYTDLAMACPTGEQFYPAGRLKKMVSQVLRSAKNFQSTYALPPGPMRLRSQIARRGLQLGMLLSAENILITHGAMEALSLAVRASTRPGDCIALEVPTFYNLYPMLEDLGRRIIGIPTHPLEGMCLNTLEHTVSEQNVRAVITVPSGQNPLGFTMSVENRQRLARMASENKFAVIEDAVYADLQYCKAPVPNIKAFDEDGWVIVCASYTKTLSPDFRVGWLEAGRFRERARQLKFTSTVAEPALLSETLGMFLENGSYDLHLRHLRRLYNAQIDAFRVCIAQSFPAGTRVSRPQCGFILWIELPGGIDTLTLFHKALDEKILCMPGLLCSGSRAFSHCLRLAVCFELSERHVMGIKRLGHLAQHLLNNELHTADVQPQT